MKSRLHFSDSCRCWPAVVHRRRKSRSRSASFRRKWLRTTPRRRTARHSESVDDIQVVAGSVVASGPGVCVRFDGTAFVADTTEAPDHRPNAGIARHPGRSGASLEGRCRPGRGQGFRRKSLGRLSSGRRAADEKRLAISRREGWPAVYPLHLRRGRTARRCLVRYGEREWCAGATDAGTIARACAGCPTTECAPSRWMATEVPGWPRPTGLAASISSS